MSIIDESCAYFRAIVWIDKGQLNNRDRQPVLLTMVAVDSGIH